METTAGNRGDNIRSDCFITLELTQNKGREIQVKSKVGTLYGSSIERLCRDMLDFYQIENARLIVDDQGALPFTLAARIECAIKQLIPDQREYLLPLETKSYQPTCKDSLRRSRLYLPGNQPKLMINAGIYGADGIILDLEDSVAPNKKTEARYLVRNALRSIDFYGAERMVRINQLPMGLEDLEFVVHHGVNMILIPKCESPEQVTSVDKKIEALAGKPDHNIHLMPIIESSPGIIRAYEIACASPNIAALTIGLEDYTADIGVIRTPEGIESFYARSVIVNAARAARIQPIDSVFSDVNNIEALSQTIQRSKALGFTGMGCIHPRQVPFIHKGYAPSEQEILKAQKIVFVFEKAKQEGSGVVALGSKMVDAPVVKQALQTIDLAEKIGIISNNWRQNHEG